MSEPRHYYNEIEPYAVAWLRNLMAEGLIPEGDIDTRSIEDVRPDELAGYVQCHFFAGIAGWPLALAIAGWPVDRPVWTGSCPCQPFSSAGKRAGFADQRHLWPAWYHLISQCRPQVLFGEQVASAIDWLGLVSGDLEALAYAVECKPIEAASAGADHRRDRFFIVADTDRSGFGAGRWQGLHQSREAWAFASQPDESALADAGGTGLAQRERERGILREVGGESEGKDAANDYCIVDVADANGDGCEPRNVASTSTGHRRSAEPSDRSDAWLIGHDGKARRVEPSIRLLAHGISARVGKLRAFGNAIDPRPASQFIAAYAEARGIALHSVREAV